MTHEVDGRNSHATDDRAPAELERLRIVWRLCMKNWRGILRIICITTILCGAYAFIMPQTFTSSVSILPPQSDDRGAGLVEILAGQTPLFDMSATLGFGGRPSDIFIDILNSRTVGEMVIRDQTLQDYFGITEGTPIGLALEQLRNATNIESAKDGLITITVSLETGYFASQEEIASVKQEAAGIANGYARALDEVNREKMISRARNSRRYIEEQLVVTRGELDSAYNRLVAFQRKSHLLSLDKQLESIIHIATEIRSQFLKAQTDLALGENELTQSSRLLTAAQERVNEMQRLYREVIIDGDLHDTEGGLGLRNLPEIGRDLGYLLREVKMLEELNLYLNRQYYKEKVQEARDLPTVQILDPAVPAYQRTSPRRLMWIVVSFFLSILVAISVTLVREAARKRNAVA